MTNRFKTKLLLAIFPVIFCLASKAQPLHSYTFNGVLTGIGGAPALTQNLTCGALAGAFGVQTVAVTGQTCTASTVFCFNDGAGLNYPNPSYITNQYTVHLFFKFNTLGGYARVIDFKNSTTDNGAYLLNNCLNFYNNGNVGTCPFFTANIYYLLTLVRNGATNIVTVYVNGNLFTTYNDAAGGYACTTNTTPIIFFRDDNVVSCEAQPGCVRYISVSSATSNATQVMSTFTNICNVILPVELGDFAAQEKENQVQLKWSTETEKNNKNFDIERSADGIEFTKIAEMRANGTTQQKTDYSAIDPSPLDGVNYYRLKQNDFDGSFDYSNIASVDLSHHWPLVYPNPANDIIYVQDQKENTVLVIRNVLGEEVLNETIRSTNQISIAVLSSGTYFVYLGNKVQKLVINR